MLPKYKSDRFAENALKTKINVFKSRHLKSINIPLTKSNYKNKINSKVSGTKGIAKRDPSVTVTDFQSILIWRAANLGND